MASDADKTGDEHEAKEEAKEEPTEPQGLKILTAENFDTFVSQKEHVIVMFFAPCKYRG